ncbi:MAG: DUF401 family protein [Candidatus Brocadiaceae bacterium]|jgi:hypothetical protein
MLEAVLNAPVLVKVMGALGLILLLSRLTRHLIVAIAAGAVVLAFWSGHSPQAALAITWERLSGASTLCLLVIIFQVIWLSSQMAATGVMEDLVGTVRSKVSRRSSMAVLPAVIGLLPMPGGALFSAPLVDSCDAGGEVPAELKAKTNHWFRHIWEYWWPLYPGVLLAMEQSGLEVWQFMLLQIPLTLAAVGSGYLFLLRRIHPGGEEPAPAPEEVEHSFLGLVLPIVVVIVGYAAVRLGYAGVLAAWPGAPAMNKYVPMMVGLFAAMGFLQLRRPLARAEWREILFSRRAILMAAIVAVVRVYGAFIEARLPGGELLVSRMRGEMADWGIPLLVIMMAVPFVSGLATGLSIGFVGASFPIVINLIGPDPTLNVLLSTVVLAYGFGYIGMLVSPVHVCLVVTSEHFSTELLHNMAGLLKPGVVVLAWVLVQFAAVRLLFG